MNDPRNIFWEQRDFKSEQQQSEPEKANAEPEQNKTEKSEQTVEQRVEEMKKLASKYQREGEGQLIKDILNNVVEQKARGQLSNDQLLAFAKRVTPLLNADQRDRLGKLMEQLLKL